MNIVFYDGASQGPYDSSSLRDPGAKIGGTEATAVRIALGLAARHKVTVIQTAWSATSASTVLDGVKWCGADDGATDLREADVIVFLRRISDGLKVRLLNRKAKLFVWYHDWYDDSRSQTAPIPRARIIMKAYLRVAIHATLRVSAIAVSRTHEANIRAHLAEARLFQPVSRRLAVTHVYNPTPEPPSREPSAIDHDKLIFISAPWKGLSMVLQAFRAVRAEMPSLRLVVASPGYSRVAPGSINTDGVSVLGHLPRETVLEEVATALCVFYPADRVPETFGLVFTDSHSVGTPVLAHRFGAAEEILGPEELVDARDAASIVEKIREWRAGARPTVGLRPEFMLSAVLSRWEAVLTTKDSQGAPTSDET